MVSVILLMAGIGKRVGLNKNKALAIIGNKPMYKYSLDLFKKYNFEIICVINPNDLDELKDSLPNDVKVVFGGAERSDSVLEGLKVASGDYVLIHDSARPFLSSDVIDEILRIKNDNNCILTYFDVKDTIKEKGEKLKTLKRDSLIAASTPQCGSKAILLDSYLKRDKNISFTDDISLVEYYNPDVKIDLVKANPESFKITTPLDLKIAELLWRDYD